MPMLTTSVMVCPVWPAPRADLVGELRDPLQDAADLGHDVVAVDQDGGVAAVAQGGVEHSTVLGRVDRLAREHPPPPALEVGGPGELDQQVDRRLGDPVLREIDQDAVDLAAEPVEPAGILGEQVAQMHPALARGVRFERRPGRTAVGT
jgi:hypothetical protein